MDFEDRVTIRTPEGVLLELTLAGLGSRSAAAVIDGLIKLAITIVLGIFAALLLPEAASIGFAAVLTFGLLYGYDTAFEVLNSGRTPGKKVSGIRVVQAGGGPVGFVASSIRNVLRLVDLLPMAYAAGLISILATKRNQRLGDLAAGTIVIRDRHEKTVSDLRLPEMGSGPVWDVSLITPEEVTVIRRFLERRDSLQPDARSRLAEQIAEPLRPRVVGPEPGIHPEWFLQRIVAEKSSRQ